MEVGLFTVIARIHDGFPLGSPRPPAPGLGAAEMLRAVSRVRARRHVTLGLHAGVVRAVVPKALLVATVVALALVVPAEDGLGAGLALAARVLHARVGRAVGVGRPLLVARIPVTVVGAAVLARHAVLTRVGEKLALAAGAAAVAPAVPRRRPGVAAALGKGGAVVCLAGVTAAERAGCFLLLATGVDAAVVGAEPEVLVTVP